MRELDISIASNNSIGVVVHSRIVVFLEIVVHQLAVIAIVVPVSIVRIVSNTHAVWRFVIHVNVAAQQSIGLVFHSEVRQR